MMRMLVAALLLAWAGPGQAGVIYRFTLDGAAPGVTQAEGSLELKASALANGLAIHADQNGATRNWTRLGLLDLSFTVNGQTVTLANLVRAPSPWSMLRWSLDLASAPGAAPTGTLSFNTGGWDMSWRLQGAGSGGRFGTDDPALGSACVTTGACTFTGNLALAASGSTARAPVAAPEPATVALFGLGLAGLLAAARHRRRPG